jgi:hypothetical protein
VPDRWGRLQLSIRHVGGIKREGTREELLRQLDAFGVGGSGLAGAVIQQQSRTEEAVFGVNAG